MVNFIRRRFVMPSVPRIILPCRTPRTPLPAPECALTNRCPGNGRLESRGIEQARGRQAPGPTERTERPLHAASVPRRTIAQPLNPLFHCLRRPQQKTQIRG
jgi:hypothetical protein